MQHNATQGNAEYVSLHECTEPVEIFVTIVVHEHVYAGTWKVNGNNKREYMHLSRKDAE